MMLTEVKILIEGWWRKYNQIRSHSAFGYRLSASEAILSAITQGTPN